MPSKKVLEDEVSQIRSRKRKADVAIHLQDPDEEVTEMTRKKQCPAQTCWSPSTSPGGRGQCGRIPTPEQGAEPVLSLGFSQYTPTNVFLTPTRPSPLPALCWANKDDVWLNLLKKERLYLHDVHLLQKHPNIQPAMRSILLDWLMEVCEVYKLHRETFYLGRDYLDRFLATQVGVAKTTLQLIGISALFIAAKMEEIYPPKLPQFAYVTDGACTEEEILNMEVIIMKELNWSLSPVTQVSWLSLYMQISYLNPASQILHHHYPPITFTQICQLLDVCVLDVESLRFSNSLLAASALFHFSSLELVIRVSGLKWAELEECVRWMVPFAMAIREAESSPLKSFKGIPEADAHNIQTHAPYLEWLNRAHSYQQADLERSQSSPAPSGLLTPPPSSEKPEDPAPSSSS